MESEIIKNVTPEKVIDVEGTVVSESEIAEKSVVKAEKTSIQKFNFERVNFKDPTSTLRYGLDSLNKISQIMEAVAKAMEGDQFTPKEVEEKIAKTSNFKKYVDAARKEKRKQENPINQKIEAVKQVGVNVIQFFNKDFEPKQKENLASYKTQYFKYCEDLEGIVEFAKEEMNNILKDVNLKKDFVNKLVPYVEQLEEVIRIGYEDLEKFKSEELAPMETRNQLESTPELIQDIVIAKQLVELFGQKLLELEKNLMAIKNSIVSTKLQQGNDLQLMISFNSYVTTTSPLLKLTAVGTVAGIKQGERADVLQKMIDSGNDALKSNALVTVDNIEKVTALAVQGNISPETLETMRDALVKGSELLEQRGEVVKQARSEQRTMLEQMRAELAEYSLKIENTLNAEGVDLISVYGKNGGKSPYRKMSR